MQPGVSGTRGWILAGFRGAVHDSVLRHTILDGGKGWEEVFSFVCSEFLSHPFLGMTSRIMRKRNVNSIKLYCALTS